MSNFAIEKLLWQTFTNPESAGAFREDAETFLGGFRVDDEEKALLKEWDVLFSDGAGAPNAQATFEIGSKRKLVLHHSRLRLMQPRRLQRDCSSYRRHQRGWRRRPGPSRSELIAPQPASPGQSCMIPSNGGCCRSGRRAPTLRASGGR